MNVRERTIGKESNKVDGYQTFFLDIRYFYIKSLWPKGSSKLH